MALFNSIWDDFRHAMRSGNMVTKLVLVNCIVFVAVSLVYVGLYFGMNGSGHGKALWVGLEYLCMPADWRELIWRPWTPFTSMFLHADFWHILSNMIWLYLFGTIVGDLMGDRRVLPIYLLGGLVGAFTYFLSANFLSYVGDYALGASAAVMALGGTALLVSPDYRVVLFLIGEVKLKYIVLIMVLLDLVGFANQANTGGHAAHLGGLLMGLFFVYQLRAGRDIAEPVNQFIETLQFKSTPTRKPKMKYKKGKEARSARHKTDVVDQSHEEKLNNILDKIKEHGYEQLTEEEKEFLFQASRK